MVQVLSDRDSLYRREAVWSLGFFPKDLALKPLLRTITDRVPEIREEAARALCSDSFLSEETIAALLRALLDPASPVRVAAAYTLGWFSACNAITATLSAKVGNLVGDRGEAARRGAAARVSLNQRKAQRGS